MLGLGGRIIASLAQVDVSAVSNIQVTLELNLEHFARFGAVETGVVMTARSDSQSAGSVTSALGSFVGIGASSGSTALSEACSPELMSAGQDIFKYLDMFGMVGVIETAVGYEPYAPQYYVAATFSAQTSADLDPATFVLTADMRAAFEQAFADFMNVDSSQTELTGLSLDATEVDVPSYRRRLATSLEMDVSVKVDGEAQADALVQSVTATASSSGAATTSLQSSLSSVDGVGTVSGMALEEAAVVVVDPTTSAPSSDETEWWVYVAGVAGGVVFCACAAGIIFSLTRGKDIRQPRSQPAMGNVPTEIAPAGQLAAA